MLPDEQRLLDFFNNKSKPFDPASDGPTIGHPNGYNPKDICLASDQWLEESHD